MKTLRAKLFLSVGIIMLIASALNIVLAEIWIKKGLARKGDVITKYVKTIEEKVERFSSFLLTLRMVEEATDLERVVYMISSFQESLTKSLWKQAEEIVSYDPQIAFVQMQKEEEGISIAPQDAILHPFSFVLAEDKGLFVKVEGKEGLFAAIPIAGASQEDYLLFAEEEVRKAILQNDKLQDQFAFVLKPLHPGTFEAFQSVQMKKVSYGIQDSVPQLFQALLSNENEWLYKMDLIQALLSWPEKMGLTPLGAIKIAGQTGGCLWADEVFSKVAPFEEKTADTQKKELFLLVREGSSEKDIDVVREVSLEGRSTIRLGFSVLRVLREIALLSDKIVLIKAEDVNLGIRPNGQVFDANSAEFLSKSAQYVSFDIDFSLFSISVLTPEDESLAVNKFLGQLGSEMIVNVSLSLLGAALISFVIALILLHNIANKITKPIAILSKAAEHLGSGKYEGIIFPKIGSRQDEVAKLTHSFTGMVNALQDRDKIRGVLHKVVSKEISDEILKGDLDFTGEERVLTLLFSDIRNFTKITEGLSPRILIPMLNLYMTRMCHIIDLTHGVVDKFVGDEIMTLYGAPVP
ncbi:MAG: adenylate/guanylate cyclase domain-containing protein, partial [Verrucomicrobia bacterium]|nr:adenylate/guanylate cyclase domain-containing protein [Verrucomicrobiota bacterium]